jgi:hypothetical protein
MLIFFPARTEIVFFFQVSYSSIVLSEELLELLDIFKKYILRVFFPIDGM